LLLRSILCLICLTLGSFAITLNVNARNPVPVEASIEAGEYTVTSSGSWSAWRSDDDPLCRYKGCWSQSINVNIKDITTIKFNSNKTTENVCVPKDTIISSRIEDCSYCYGDNRGSMTIEFTKTDQVQYRPFPQLDMNYKIIDQWISPEDRSQECLDINGSVEDAEMNCKRMYRCVIKSCFQPDSTFPDLAQNERILFEWDEQNDRSAECTSSPIEGRVQTALQSCKKRFRCVKETLPECPRNEQVGSYVDSFDGTLHEDIELTGTDIGLHYTSRQVDLNNTHFFGGWTLDIHHALENGYIYLGNGDMVNISSRLATDEQNRTVVSMGPQRYIFDKNGRHIETYNSFSGKKLYLFKYDSNGTLSSIEDGYGNVAKISYMGNTTIVTAPGGQKTKIELDDSGNLSKITFEDGSKYAFIYDGSGRLVEKIDPNGNRFEYIYDEKGRVVKTVDPENASWLFGVASGEDETETVVTRPAGDILRYKDFYLKNDILESKTIYPDGHVFTQRQSLDGSEAETLSCGMKNIYRYKTKNGEVVKDLITGEPQLAELIISTSSGLVKRVEYETKYTFESNKTILKIEKSIATNGKSYSYIRDLKDHNASFTTPEGRVVQTVFDVENRHATQITMSGFYPLKLYYDHQGRLATKTFGFRTTNYMYDSAGNLTEQIDALGRSTKYLYDSLGRIVAITTPGGRELHFSYDSNGNVTVLTTPTGANHSFEYNGVNLKTSYVTPVDVETKYIYDAQRRLVKILYPSGRSVEYLYKSGRLNRVKTPEGDTLYEYECGSLPAKISRSDESVSYEYDGQLVTKVLFNGVLNDVIRYEYNDDMQPSSVEYAGGITRYGYDEDGYLSSAGNLSISREFKFRNVTHYEENGYSRYKMYNGYGEPSFSINDDYVYGLIRDRQGRIVVKIEYTNNRLYFNRYEYDEDGRLTAVYNNGRLSESYTYDANGNRLLAKVRGVNFAAQNTLDDRLQVYGDNTYRYDEDGFLIEKNTPEGTIEYSYDATGALTGVALADGTRIRYLQNALGQRVAKEVNGTIVEKYLWRDLTTLLALYDGDGKIVQRFEYADERVPYAMTMNGKRYYLHYDHLGTLKTVTDINHTVVKALVYDSYGIYQSIVIQMSNRNLIS